MFILATDGSIDVDTFLFIAAAIYFLPTLLARHDRLAIFFANLLFGWTIVGWGIVLVWALIKPKIYLVDNRKPEWRIDRLLNKKRKD
jgi:hypothetical protein